MDLFKSAAGAAEYYRPKLLWAESFSVCCTTDFAVAEGLCKAHGRMVAVACCRMLTCSAWSKCSSSTRASPLTRLCCLPPFPTPCDRGSKNVRVCCEIVHRSFVTLAQERQLEMAFVVVPLVSPMAARDLRAVLSAAAIVWLILVPVHVNTILTHHRGLASHPRPLALPVAICVSNPRPRPVAPHVLIVELESVGQELLLVIGGDGGEVAARVFAGALGLEPGFGLVEEHVAVLVARL